MSAAADRPRFPAVRQSRNLSSRRRGAGTTDPGVRPGASIHLLARVLDLVLAGAILATAACGGGQRAGKTPDGSVPGTPPAYVGSAACRECHAREWDSWSGSHHALATQPADEGSVEGDFDGAAFSGPGISVAFGRRGDAFVVRTKMPDGAAIEGDVAATIGVDPVQQYLISLPGGRLQPLPVAWDSRPRAAGGQRWFLLPSGQSAGSRDRLPWSAPARSWNADCASCHSTDVQKGYDPATRAYDTRWSERSVGCEACHGPGSNHAAREKRRVRQAPGGSPGGEAAGDIPDSAERGAAGSGKRSSGLAFGGRARSDWIMDEATGTARLRRPRGSRAGVAACAPCHARRTLLAEGGLPGRPLTDTCRPALLDDALYFPDGQARGVTYVYGSFLQTRMYASGVECADCHDPHTLRLRAEGNALCTRCHAPARYDAPSHHHHPPGSDGSRCIACHMPARIEMGVDRRVDHSFPVPRPDLAREVGVPEPCTGCHEGRPAGWARDQVQRWTGGGGSLPSGFGRAIRSGREGGPGAHQALARLATDVTRPAIVRATALDLLRFRRGSGTDRVRQEALADADPLVRMAAARLLEGEPPWVRLRLATPLTGDPSRAVRLEAARLLASVPAGGINDSQRVGIDAAVAELRAAQSLNADRPAGRRSLAWLEMVEGRLDDAAGDAREAVRLDPGDPASRLRLAEIERRRGNDAEETRVLREGIEVTPESADLHHALGLALVRGGRRPEGIGELSRASGLAPGRTAFAVDLGSSLHEAGRDAEARDVLDAALAKDEEDPDALRTLAVILRDAGRPAEALVYARRLAAVLPRDAVASTLVGQLERMAAGR